MTKVALVVVDLQEDFLPTEGSLAVPEGRDIISPTIDLLDTEKYPWTTIIATQDWHPADHCSFASVHNVPAYSQLEFEHPLGEKDESGKVKTQTQFVWPDHCVQHSFGAAIEPLFLTVFERVKVPTTIVKKGYLQDREYYSCFKDIWKIHKTEIEDYLKNQGITDVVFCGLAYDFCVMNSAVDSAKSGFNTYVLKQYCRSVYPDKIKETDQTYIDGGVKIILESDLANLLK